MTDSTNGLDFLLDLDGQFQVQNEAGYWIKIEVSRVDATTFRPHGISYSLTLHAPDGTRLIGFDNAHAVPPTGSRFKHAGKIYPYDHQHRHQHDKGTLYEFDSGWQLMNDFYEAVNKVLEGLADE